MKKKLKHFNKLVESLGALPSIGKKSALRIAYHLSIANKYSANNLVNSIENALSNVRICKLCNQICENEICEICVDSTRGSKKVCIVESAQDILLIEQSDSFDGKYFVLERLNEEVIDQLVDFTKETKEVIFALVASVQNDSLILFIEDKLNDTDIVFSKIATGVPNGVRLENVDILSLSKALNSRVPI